MKWTQLVLSVAFPGIVATLAAGTMYLSVRAAQQDVEFNPPTPPLPETAPVATPALSADQIRADRSHAVVLDQSSGFVGHLISLDTDQSGLAKEYTVRLLQNGLIAAETISNAEGTFSFSSLKSGPAGLLAFNENGFMMFGLRLIENDGRKSSDAETDAPLELESAPVAISDVSLTRQLIAAGLAGAELRFTGDLTADDQLFHYGTGRPATSLKSHRVQLSADGTLTGTVACIDPRTGRHREVLDMTIHFLNQGRVVTKIRPDNSGAFRVSGLPAGVYGVVGTGLDGTFAIGVEVVDLVAQSIAESATSSSEYTTVAVETSLELAVAAVTPSDFNAANASGLTNSIVNPTDIPCSCGGSCAVPCGDPCCGAAAGGAYGGGGFGGGGGGAGGGAGGAGFGLGALLGGAIGGGIGFLVGDGDGSGGGGNTPASPGQ